MPVYPIIILACLIFLKEIVKKNMYFQQGIDIVEIRRISKIYEKFGINFLIKVLSKQELKIVPTQKKKN